MRRAIVAGLVVGLIVGANVPAVAQDEAEVELQRVEVLEAGVAMSFPAGWNVDIEMREREDWGLSERYEDAAPLAFWRVLYASADGRPWCDLTWYPHHPMTLTEHAAEYQALMTPSLSDVERSIEMTPATLPAGEAVRFVIHNGPIDDYTTVYLLDPEVGRYFLECVSHERVEDDWLSIAETLGWLAAPEP